MSQNQISVSFLFLFHGFFKNLFICLLVLRYNWHATVISFREAIQWFGICMYCKMITTVNQVNVCHYIWLNRFFFLWWDLLRCTHNNFQICNKVLLTIVVKLYITSPWLIYFITVSLYLLTAFTHFAHPLLAGSGNYQSVLCIYLNLVLGIFLSFYI